MTETTKKTKSPAKPKAAASKKKPAAETVSFAPPPRDRVAQLAYELWMSGGCKMGDADQNWLHAEQKLMSSPAPY